ncbi:MAG: deoxyribodipyrimidine photo-lyase [Alphaproteobacteria bacterium]|nr:MAG: deoxyribodipyrimidine photo-lyase [Alphaproteobacteria bacterium]
MTADPHIVWLRRDLRLADQPAVAAAADRGPVLFVYVLDETAADGERLGGAARWWLDGTLAALGRDIAARGGALVLRHGDAAAIVPALAQDIGAGQVHATRHGEPAARRQQAALEKNLAKDGRRLCLHRGGLMVEPGTLTTQSGESFKVFTPFWRAWQQALGTDRGQVHAPVAPLPAPKRLAAPAVLPASDRLADWRLRPRAPDWAHGLAAMWTPGEAAAADRLRHFIADGARRYGQRRDRMDQDGTSRLSPHLHWGEISANQICDTVMRAMPPEDALPFIRQLAWRDFCHSLLDSAPDLAARAWNPRFRNFPWRHDGEALHAWQRGETGYPIVDAAMRALWHTGWMHNRARMIVASFLTKHLLIHWRQGAAWFWDTLVDADRANNSAGWQWVAGSGADAAPYFRVFNPVLQGRKYDPDGVYVRRWLPELARLPNAHIHAPWQAPKAVLADAGVRLGADYPFPIVEHQAARQRALAAYAGIKAH